MKIDMKGNKMTKETSEFQEKVTQIYTDKMTKMLNDGLIEKTIEKEIESVVKSITDSVFREYGDFGSKLKKKIEESLAAKLDDIDLAQQTTIIMQMINAQIGNSIQDKKEIIAKLVSDVFSKPPKEMSLNDLICKYVKSDDEDDEEFFDQYMSLYVIEDEESSFGSYINYRVYADPRPDIEQDKCDIKFRLYLDQIISAEIKEYPFDKHECVQKIVTESKHPSRTAKHLFSLMHHNTKVTDIDEDNVNTAYKGL